AAILEKQHRTKLIALYVCRFQARIIVVDRGSFVISNPFGWRTKDDPTLYEFFWRLALLSGSKEVLGFDLSKTLSDFRGVCEQSKWDLRVKKMCKQWVDYISRKMRLSMPTSQWPFYRLNICGKKYLIAAPSTTSSALFGPSRRIFIAYCEDDDELRTVKDYWRLDSDAPAPREHDIYARLAVTKVRNVPECECGEDVTVGPGGDQQRTATLDRWGPDPPRTKTLVHYRIVLKQVYKPLLNFGDFQSLCGDLADAMEAHLDACEKAHLIHRSISLWSVGLYVFPGEVTPRCLLGDWEWAKTEEEIAQRRARRDVIPGAWYFHSALVANFPARGHAVSDDVESFIHLFQYSVLRFTRTSCTPHFLLKALYKIDEAKILPKIVNMVYGDYVLFDGERYNGGDNKLLFTQRSTSWIKPQDKQKKPLTALLKELAKMVHEHYGTFNADDYTEEFYSRDSESPTVLFSDMKISSDDDGGSKVGGESDYAMSDADDGADKDAEDPDKDTMDTEDSAPPWLPSYDGPFTTSDSKVLEENGPLKNHAGLLNLFRKYHGEVRWRKEEAKIDGDLFLLAYRSKAKKR
ncbi:uncharacterized protein BXZ73DRAFT_57926, partial [Epithele typhae]|uniref:uncharacterized protein n=1 Tax=Epithele typhae TaxID=378194 RepID=UPI0020078C3D